MNLIVFPDYTQQYYVYIVTKCKHIVDLQSISGIKML